MLKLEQVVIEDKYSKKNIREKVMNELTEVEDGEFKLKINDACKAIQKYLRGYYYDSKEARIDHLFEQGIAIENIVYEILLIVMPTTGYQTIQSVCGRLAPMLGFKNVFDGIKTAGELIAAVCESDLYDIVLPAESFTGSALVLNKYELSPELMQYITNTKYLPPMICKPRKLKGNWGSGYITVPDQVMLKGKTHEGEMPLDVINIRNQIALSLDTRMLEIEEVPKNALETPEQVANFDRMKKASFTVYEDLLNQGNKFYLTNKVDERLRMYAQGYHCNYQSGQYKRSVVNLHKQELIV